MIKYYGRVESYESFGDRIQVTFDVVEETSHDRFGHERPLPISEIHTAFLTIKAGKELLTRRIKAFKYDCWYELTVNNGAINRSYIQVDTYHYTSQDLQPRVERLTEIREHKKRSKKAKELASCYQLSNISGYEEALTSPEEIAGLIPNIQHETLLKVHRVGQGSCNSIANIENQEIDEDLIFLGAGGGVLANADTYHKPDLNISDETVVLLCHWDLDHWMLGLKKQALSQRQWLVPEQKNMGASHIKFAQSLSNNGFLNIWPKSLKQVSTSAIDIYKLPENKNRNYSGLVFVFAVNGVGSKNAIYSGDAPFSRCKSFLSQYNLSVVLTPHHAGKMPFRDIPKSLNTSDVVISSYGVGNTYNHPFTGNGNSLAGTQQRYIAKGWYNWLTTERCTQLIALHTTILHYPDPFTCILMQLNIIRV